MRKEFHNREEAERGLWFHEGDQADDVLSDVQREGGTEDEDGDAPRCSHRR